MHRRGTAIIVAIVCLLLVTAIGFSLVRFAVAAQQQAQRQGWRLQSTWLAESGLSRAALRLRDDPGFSSDTWTIENIGTASETARIEVVVTTSEENVRARTISVTADFPADPTDRVRTTRRLTLTLPDSVPAPTN